MSLGHVFPFAVVHASIPFGPSPCTLLNISLDNTHTTPVGYTRNVLYFNPLPVAIFIKDRNSLEVVCDNPILSSCLVIFLMPVEGNGFSFAVRKMKSFQLVPHYVQ